jgi:hypothetical protein
MNEQSEQSFRERGKALEGRGKGKEGSVGSEKRGRKGRKGTKEGNGIRGEQVRKGK